MKKLFVILVLCLSASVCMAQTSVQGRRFDVRSWGAKCDASTDDTTAIAAAITAATATGGIVDLPDGTCVVTGISVPGGVTLRGKGRDVTFIKSTTNAVIVNAVQGSGTFLFLGPEIYDLTIRGTLAAGSSQIGLKVDDALYMARVSIQGVTINQAGSHGLYVGNAFSSRFVDIYSDNDTGYPFLINSANMPSNHYESLYAQQTTSTGNAGFRVMAGNFICISCNGINASAAGSYNAILGSKVGVDGSVSNISAYAHWINCNFESALAGGILHYYNSRSDFSGHNQFAGDGSASGSYKAMVYEVDTAIFPPYFTKGTIKDGVVFANSPASYYANSSPIWSNDLPPLTVDGQGPKIAGDAFQTSYYNSTTSRIEKLYRSDAYLPVTAVTTSTSFTNPGNSYYEVTCVSDCTLTLPWPGWYQPAGQSVIVKNLSASGVLVTISANSGGSVNGSSYVMSIQGASVQLYPDSISLDWRVTGNRLGAMSVDYYPIADSANTLTTSGTQISKSGSNLLFSATTLYGTDNTLDIGSSGDNRPRHIYAATDLTAPKIYNVGGGACFTSGSATPEGSVTCEAGSIYLRTNGSWYQKASGSGNTGWVVVGTGSGTITGSGSTNTIPKFSSSTALADSIITESSGPATISIAGRESITGLTINTDATNTVASLTAAATFTKNDTNTRTFDVVRIKPTFNFGGSNTGTTVNLLSVDSTNTAVTGGSFNLLSLSYGGTLKFSVDSAGAVAFANGVRQVFTPSTTVASLNFGQVASDPSSGVNGDCVYQTGSSKFRCYENGAWANMIGATPTLTSTQVPFGDGSNLLTSSSAFTYNTSTKLLSIVNGSGAASLTLNGSSDTSKVNFGAGSVPGNQGGIVFPFVGGGMSSGPGVWWCSSASYASCSGLYINNGLTYQGTNSTHDHFKVAAATGSSSNGTVVWDFSPTSSLLTQTMSTSATGTAHVGNAITLTSTGTAAANFGYSQTFTLENGSGSNVAATSISHVWNVATAGAETGEIAFNTNLGGAGVGQAFAISGSQYYGTIWDKGNISGAVTLDFINGNTVTATLTGNVTSLAFSNLRSGGVYFIHFIQNALGPWTLTVPAALKVNGGYVITATINKRDLLICSATSTTQLYCSKAQDQQ